MLIGNSLAEAWRDVKHELHRGVLDRNHPFRFAVVSTVDGDQPLARYVVVRSIEEDLEIKFYTDKRSAKAHQLTLNPNVCLLLYHPTKMVQVIIRGKSKVHSSDAVSEKAWDQIDPAMRKPYTPLVPPGTEVSSPQEAHQWPEEITSEHFACVSITPEVIEVLELNKLEHYRARFERVRGWNGVWVAP